MLPLIISLNPSFTVRWPIPISFKSLSKSALCCSLLIRKPALSTSRVSAPEIGGWSDFLSSYSFVRSSLFLLYTSMAPFRSSSVIFTPKKSSTFSLNISTWFWYNLWASGEDFRGIVRTCKKGVVKYFSQTSARRRMGSQVEQPTNPSRKSY